MFRIVSQSQQFHFILFYKLVRDCERNGDRVPVAQPAYATDTDAQTREKKTVIPMPSFFQLWQRSWMKLLMCDQTIMLPMRFRCYGVRCCFFFSFIHRLVVFILFDAMFIFIFISVMCAAAAAARAFFPLPESASRQEAAMWIWKNREMSGRHRRHVECTTRIPTAARCKWTIIVWRSVWHTLGITATMATTMLNALSALAIAIEVTMQLQSHSWSKPEVQEQCSRLETVLVRRLLFLHI